MAQPYRDKVVIILGGGSGIGAALAGRLHGRGARIVIADVQHETAAAVAEPLAAEAHAVDITRGAQVDDLLRDVVHRHRRIDYLFNCAGLVPIGPLDELHDDARARTVDVNLTGLIAACRAAGRIMAAQREGGTIVNLASLAGLVPLPMGAVYSATKAGVVALSLALRAELRDRRVRVVCICPGIVDTPLVDNTFMALNTPDAARVNMRPGRGQSATSCAGTILRAAARDRALTVTPLAARLTWWLYRVAPWFYHRWLAPAIGRRYHRRRARREARVAARAAKPSGENAHNHAAR